ncbi:MAG: metallophosphoesterase [Nitrospirae bacterium]|nr:metallophosphoesterase [Nitrospirota bacterium]
MPKKLSWLHLSDFHYSEKIASTWELSRGLFFNDINRLLEKEKVGPWDIVFFTGDLVGHGKKEEFDKLNDELTILWDNLPPKSDGKKPILLCVPGNHDLKRPDEKMKKSAIYKAFKRWNEDPDVSEIFWESDDNDYRGLVNDAFANYDDWLKSCRFLPPDGIVRGSIPGDFSYSTEINGIKLGVIGLNSAFLHLDDVELGELALHGRQILRVAGDIDKFCAKHDINILLTNPSPRSMASQ